MLAARRGPAAPCTAAAGASSAFCACAFTHGSMPCFCTTSRNDTRVHQ
ncbi:putative lipoprotein [Burkholderia pseudomallei S13]|nr:putative lipoprotein [Burkholderia pseudomallei S13]